jgi:hypothetical protein
MTVGKVLGLDLRLDLMRHVRNCNLLSIDR